MGFNFGAFAGGLAEGINKGTELKLRKQESDLKSKLIKHQMETMEFDQAEKKRQADIATNEREQRAADAQAAQSIFSGGQQARAPAPLEAGQEGPVALPGFQAAATPGNQQLTVPQMFQIQALRAGKTQPTSAAASGPKTLEALAVQALQSNDKTKATEILGMKPRQAGEAGLSAQQLQEIYGMDPAQAQRVASLPPKTQERTLDNLRGDQTQKRGEARDERLASQFNIAEDRRTQQFQEREKREQGRLQIQEDERRMPRLSGKEREELREVRQQVIDLKRAQTILTKSKGAFTGPIDTRVGKAKAALNLAPAEQLELNRILARLNNRIRNKQFGAALTVFESAEAMKELPDPSQADKIVSGKVGDLVEIFSKVNTDLQGREDFWKNRGASRGTVTPQMAVEILKEAGGDKEKAREIARQRGLRF